MSLASVFSITAMLLILGMSFVLVVNISVFMEKAKEGYDTIQLYLEDDVAEWQKENIQSTLDGMPEVASVTYLPKEVALEQWKDDWGENAFLLDSLSTNPLPDAFVIRLANLESADAVYLRAGNFSGVYEVKYYKETVDKVIRVTNFIQMGALVIMGILVIISVIVVSNTIKLTVFARAEEINIMKYIGAKNWFIRGPFLVEGMLIGLFSALFSTGAIALIYYKLIDLLEVDVVRMFQIQLVALEFLTYNLLGIFAALGVSIGAWGSIISMRRFLDT